MELGASWSQQLGGNYARMTHVFWTPLLLRLQGMLNLVYTITTVCSTIIVLSSFRFSCVASPLPLKCVLSGRVILIGRETYGNDRSLGEGSSNRTRKIRQ